MLSLFNCFRVDIFFFLRGVVTGFFMLSLFKLISGLMLIFLGGVVTGVFMVSFVKLFSEFCGFFVFMVSGCCLCFLNLFVAWLSRGLV